MPIVAKDAGGGVFVPAPEGQFTAVCCDVVDLGVVETEWKGKKKSVHKVRIAYQIDENMDDGRPYVVQSTFTLSLGEKANLRKFLEAWRGKPFTPEQINEGFDVEALIGANALVQLVHAQRGDRTYANIQTIMKAPKGAAKMEVRDYVRVKDRTGEDGHEGQNGAGPGLEETPSFEDDDDGLPF